MRGTGRGRRGARGRITYAPGTREQIDWTPFDIVSADAYGEPGDAFRQGLREYRRHGKPGAATEFGCCTHRGAAEHDADPPHVTGEHVRDEEEQARHLREMIAFFDEEGVDADLAPKRSFDTMAEADRRPK